MTSAVSLQSVRKAFHGRPVIQEATASFDWGQCTSIIGPNGSGKSVLLRIVTGLIRPDGGRIRFDPVLLGDRSRRFPDLTGVVLDTPAYVGSWTVRENLVRVAQILKRATPADLDSAIERFDLASFVDTPARKLSLGTRQRLALAQATFEGQRLLVLDEAFNGLDDLHAARLRADLRERVADGACVIFTSHNPADIQEASDRVLKISDGVLAPVSPVIADT